MSTRTEAVLGVDVGTSSTKGVLVALDGTVLDVAVREHSVQRPAPGHVEMDARIWWTEFISIARELTTGVDAEVTAIGVDRKSTRLNCSHVAISYAVFCLTTKNPVTILRAT